MSSNAVLEPNGAPAMARPTYPVAQAKDRPGNIQVWPAAPPTLRCAAVEDGLLKTGAGQNLNTTRRQYGSKCGLPSEMNLALDRAAFFIHDFEQKAGWDPG